MLHAVQPLTMQLLANSTYSSYGCWPAKEKPPTAFILTLGPVAAHFTYLDFIHMP